MMLILDVVERDVEDADPEDGRSASLNVKARLTQWVDPKAGQKEIDSSLALFILIMLLVVALFTSYILQSKRIQAVHETVLSIFAGMLSPAASLSFLLESVGLTRETLGMIVGLALRLTSSTFIQSVVSFDYQFFFNLLLPPIILASGYELHQV